MKKHIFYTVFCILLAIFLIAFGMTSYRYYQAIHSDDPIDPYLLVDEGNATITRGTLAIDMTTSESYNLLEGDIVITRDRSTALVAWPDHSTTRLGPNSRLTIERMRVASDYSQIELVAVLENGKAWSNIVRTLYPDSRIEFRIPKTGTIAGVRGTVFEINLDRDYIHSMDHSVVLRNTFGKMVTLLPGDAVRATDIFEKFTSTLDAAWITLNQSKDTLYMSIRDAKLRESYDLVAGKTGISDTWDRIMRMILSRLPSFSDIDVLGSISGDGMARLSSDSQKTILRWYQALQSKDFVQERDQFRGILISLRDTLKDGDQVIDTLTRGALWDMQTFSGMSLDNTRILLDSYAKKTGTSFDLLISGIKNLDTNSLNIESRRIYEKLFQ